MNVLRFFLAVLAWFFFISPALASPVIVHQPPLTAYEKQSLELSATITDPASPIVQVKLFYRTPGALGYAEERMQGSGYNYTAAIPGNKISAAGVEYYLEARNQKGEAGTSPMLNAASAPYRVVVHEPIGAPGLTLLSPQPDSTVLPEEVVIVVAMDPGQSRVDLSTLKVILDEKEVTAQVEKTLTLLTYVPARELSPGLHGLRVRVRNLEGTESLSPTWAFTVAASGASWQAQTRTAEAAPLWQGNLDAQVQYASLQQKPEISTALLSQPEAWLNRLRFNLMGSLGDWKLLTTIYLTSEEAPGSQPVDRFRLDLLNPAWIFTLGDSYPVFTDYTLSNLFIRGGYIRWLAGKEEEAHSELVLTGGLNQLAVPGDDLSGRLGTFTRYAGGFRWLGNFLPDTGLSVNLAGLMDQPDSIAEDERGGAFPYNNATASGEGHINIPWVQSFSTRLFGEYAWSYFQQELDILTLSVGQAYRSGLRLAWDPQSSLEVEYKHTDANFVSLANPWLLTDWQGVSGNTRLQFLDGDLILTGDLNVWQDNLNGQKDQTFFHEASGTTLTVGTTRNLYTAGMINCRLMPYLSNLSAGLSWQQQQDQTEPIKMLDNVTQIINLGLGGQWPIGTSQVLANFNTLFSQYRDLAVEKLSGDLSTASYQLTGMFLYENLWSLTLGYGLNQNRRDDANFKDASLLYFLTGATEQVINYTLWNLRANWKILPSQLDVTLSWEKLVAQDDRNMLHNQLATYSLGSSYYFASSHSLGLTLSSIGYEDFLITQNNYQEFVVNLQYSLRF